MVSSMVKVSVILPIYNEEKYLAQCLDSICGQTLKEIEIICVDDGSTDNSTHILKDYAKKDSRITLITQENQFAGAARNKGMACAVGKYLSFLDADDYYAPEMLEKMVKEAEENRADIVMCRYSQTSPIPWNLKMYSWMGTRPFPAGNCSVQGFSRLPRDGHGISFLAGNLCAAAAISFPVFAPRKMVFLCICLWPGRKRLFIEKKNGRCTG